VSARTAGTYARKGRTAARRRTVRRRRLGAVLAAALMGSLVAMVVMFPVDKVVQEVTLPLRHEDVIRQQAADKGLDPALIAGVIYAESKFRDQTSPAGARGLMQITPQTADYIARKSGGTAFEQGDLATPQINIAYGSFYLRYLLDRYGNNEVLALAAYNGGEGNVDRWIEEARSRDRRFAVSEIPFPETREYVGRVESAKRQYRETYSRELGIR
jgi:soluble lytic murein transglycosylase